MYTPTSSLTVNKRPSPVLLRRLLIWGITIVISSGLTALYPLISRIVFRLSLTGNNQDIRVLLIRFLIVLAVLSVPAAWISFGFTTVNMWLHKKRWWIGLGIVGAAVLLDVNGSSLGMWNFWLGRDMSEDIILGTPRPIRTDEYIVGTPLAFSQEYSNYAFFNTIVGGTPTNMSIIKDSPVWFITELLKPFHWGYFLFGSSRGLAFYWSARIIALFLCAYEFMLIVTKDSHDRSGNKRFALISAALIAFAPLVQWWFAVNNLPEMLIAMFIAWISLDNLLKKHGAWERFGFILIIAWAACSFIITLYPAWQIPLVYLILVVSIWIISQHWGSIHFTGRNYLSVGVAIVFFIIIFLIGLFISWADIYATLNTVYPGARHEVGGGYKFGSYFSGSASLALTFKEYVPSPGSGPNATEASQFFDLFPLGIVLAVVNAIKRKKVDLLDTLLIVLLLMTMIYMIWGFPDALAKITLFTQVPTNRLNVLIGLINVILLAHAAVNFKYFKGIWTRRAVIVFLGLAAAFGSYYMHTNFIGALIAIVIFFVVSIATGAFIAQNRIIQKSSTILIIAIIMVTGLLVNPIQLSSKALTAQPLAEQVKAIDFRKKGKWIVDGDDSARIPQLLIANGITTVNTVSVTPNRDLWKVLDPDGKLDHVYNRYANIEVEIVEKREPEDLASVGAYQDTIKLKLTIRDLMKLGVTDVLSSRDLNGLGDELHRFIPVGVEVSGRQAYELQNS